ncbi:hypothetical protein G7Y89_g12188 [Cudoniella acicularis]|uniref:Zn(2)-C6 fungal-type domain-containing protein n=1 Tax=Cudoniella acicularis TaxID=354080 RepID=A0A8H4RBW1_9HELO|nr:hypothetical protein G7Y89_g12188 [Cudoniella acicularis]
MSAQPFSNDISSTQPAFYQPCSTPTAVYMESIHLATDDLGHGGAVHSPQSVQKRNRTQLSCTSCRHGKLKCDRGQPCSQCVRRGRALQCAFPLPTRKPVISLKNRLKHLESLVKDAMTAQNPAAKGGALSNSLDAPNGSGFASNGSVHSPSSLRGQDQANGQQTPASGQVLLSKGQTYVGATHWAAILEDIEEVKGFVEESLEEAGRGRSSHYNSLLWNIGSSSGKADMLANLPPRLAVDRLISRYFNCASPALFIIHRPTFNKHYRQFWLDPEGTPIIFIGLLYGFMTLATLSSLASGEAHPDTRGAPYEMLRAYKENCVQCLVLSDYTKPTQHTLETMMIYGEAEFLMSRDDQVHSYLLVSVAVRLALRMGLHRDSSKIGTHFTPFEAEFRRRIWYHVNQLDLLASFHIGLPGMVHTIESDTLPPRNLLDEDFDEDCTELPPSRPESEMTPMSYALCKGRLSDEAGNIMVLANKLQLPPFSEVLKLDSSLREANDKVPPQLRLDESEITVTDSPGTILKRFSVSVLFEKSRCMLHRKFLMKAREHSEYQYSKRAGLDASMKLLHRQGLIHQAASPGGPLPLDKWFLSSLSTHSFLLAAMIIYLNVMNGIQDPRSTDQTEIQAGVEALEVSRNNWEAALSFSPEAKRASLILIGMIDKVYRALGRQPPPKDRLIGLETDFPSRSTSQISQLSLIGQLYNNYSSVIDSSGSPAIDNSATQYHGFDKEEQGLPSGHMRTTDSTTQSSRLTIPSDLDMGTQENPLDSMLNLPDDFDWELFDTQIRPQVSAVQDAWPDLNIDLENGMNDDYNL